MGKEVVVKAVDVCAVSGYQELTYDEGLRQMTLRTVLTTEDPGLSSDLTDVFKALVCPSTPRIKCRILLLTEHELLEVSDGSGAL